MIIFNSVVIMEASRASSVYHDSFPPQLKDNKAGALTRCMQQSWVNLLAYWSEVLLKDVKELSLLTSADCIPI
jgi:hypothetical protein